MKKVEEDITNNNIKTKSQLIIEELLLYLKSNPNRLAKDLGYNSNVKIQHIKSGRNSISIDVAKDIVNKFPEINYDWLLTGEGEMLHSTKPIIREVEEVPEENYMMVEFEDLEVSAGLLGGGEVETLPERKTRLVPREYRKGYYLVVRVSGHSMYDGTARSISEGEELLIRQFEDNYLNLPIRTKLFVIVTNEGVVVKQIKNIDEKNEEITCHSFNPTYEDYIVKFHNVRQIFTVEKKVSSKIIF